MNKFKNSILTALTLKNKKISAKEINRILSHELDSRFDNIKDLSFFICSALKSRIELTSKDWSLSNKILEDNLSAGIDILPINSNRYPNSLRIIKNSPPLLFFKGCSHILESLPGVAIVGSRKASKSGKEITRRLAAKCVDSNLVVVSGLAMGIDAIAHQGALDSGGFTIAVLASGLDSPSPKSNIKLAHDILDSGGAWVSEHPIGTPARREHFVPRNRIQLGLSAGSIIVEAEMQSGSLTQAKFCIENNRPLFAVVPETAENKLGLVSEGTKHLVDDSGAIPLSSKSDYPKLLEFLLASKNHLTH